MQEESQKQKPPAAPKGGGEEAAAMLGTAEAKGDVLGSDQLQSALKLVERMGVQNQSVDVIMDFKYWDDEADAIRLDEGTLLPLWKAESVQARQKQVTCVSWVGSYSDLFIVSFGDFDSQRQTPGLVVGFSLKNSSHPEFCLPTKSGAMSVHCHPQHPHLVAVGCWDGAVLVFDVRKTQGLALTHSSSATAGQHTRPVWAVAWQQEQHGSPLAFQSLSSDGRLLLWTLATAELRCQETFSLAQNPPQGLKPDEESSRPVLAAGCCLDFHPEYETIFLVGTEEGTIHKCSSAQRTGYLQTYVGHEMSVYAVRWCPVQPQAFLSASADWTVKLWHANEAKAVMSFALGSSVGDVAWSPFSSTIFAAVTDDGLARVFDVSHNATEPLCEQRLTSKAGLTRTAFNPKLDLILIGDDRGQVATLKLSPNLRKYTKGENRSAFIMAEQSKLQAVLTVARKRAEAYDKALKGLSYDI